MYVCIHFNLFLYFRKKMTTPPDDVYIENVEETVKKETKEDVQQLTQFVKGIIYKLNSVRHF